MMKFVDTIDRENCLIIDGYSDLKSMYKAIKDLGKELCKYNRTEGEFMIKYARDLVTSIQCGDYDDLSLRKNNFWIECEEVECASKIVYKDEDEIDFDVIYDDANYYVACCIIK